MLKFCDAPYPSHTINSGTTWSLDIGFNTWRREGGWVSDFIVWGNKESLF